MIKGIACQAKAPDAAGNLTDVVTFHFATFRACPKLGSIVREITKLEVESKKAVRRRELAEIELSTCQDESQLDDLADKLQKATEEAETCDERGLVLYREFLHTGITAAGYSNDDAERFMELIDPSHLAGLISKARIGAGRVDFF